MTCRRRAARPFPGPAASPAWAEQIQRNPKNRDIILAQDPDKFIKTMERWAMFYVPPKDSPVPGMTPADFVSKYAPQQNNLSGSQRLKFYEIQNQLPPKVPLIP